MTALRSRLLVGICLSALGAPIAAQETSVSPAPAAQPADDSGEVVVTGSRIARRDFIAESPITTIDQKFVQDSGPTTVESALNALPQFQATLNAQTATTNTYGGATTGARSSANLRGLGPSRTLILFDGRRMQPSDVQGTIDLNTISPALISNVEVITGGASAVYGSDAVAGVVNFRFNNRFRGLELQADAGITQEMDGANQSISLAYGKGFADDRGRIIVSGSYLHRETADRASRKFFNQVTGTPTPTSGLYVLDGANRFGAGSAAAVAAYRNLFLVKYGTAVPSAASSLALNADGTLVGSTGAVNLRTGQASGYQVTASNSLTQIIPGEVTLQAPIDRYTGFVRAEYELSEAATLYAQGMYTTYSVDVTSPYGVQQTIVAPVIRIRADNPFINQYPDLRVALNSRPNPNGSLIYYFDASRIAPLRARQEYDVGQGLLGLKGKLGSIGYDVYASHGDTREKDTTFGSISRARLDRVLNGVGAGGLPDGGTGVCAGGYDPFGLARVSQDCANYLTLTPINRYRFKQTIVQGNLTGNLFALPGGDAAFAVGAEYRRNTYRADIDPLYTSLPTGVPGVFTVPDAAGTLGTASAAGAVSVREFYGELALPLLKDRPFFQNLDLSLAYRYSDYSTVGGTHTYRATGNWSPIRGASVRGGYSRAIRAPSLGDLYTPISGTAATIGLPSAGLGDPCDSNGYARNGKVSGVDPAKLAALCVATGVPGAIINSYTFTSSTTAAQRSGNLNLKEETADSYTVGMVLQPDFVRPVLRNLSFSVDYYNIALKDAIGFVTSAVALNQCANFNGLNPNYEASNFYCSLIKRDASGLPLLIQEPLYNLGAYKTSGIDFQAAAAVGLGPLGTLSVDTSVTYVMKYKIQNLAGEAFKDYAGTIGNTQIDANSSTHPEWKHVTSATLSGKAGGLTLRWRYIGKQDNSSNVGVVGGTAVGVPSVSYFDLVGRLRANDKFEFRAGVTNLGNKQPPTFGGPSNTVSSAYDIIGRRFFIGVTARY